MQPTRAVSTFDGFQRQIEAEQGADSFARLHELSEAENTAAALTLAPRLLE